jgi:hypothetical protein
MTFAAYRSIIHHQRQMTRPSPGRGRAQARPSVMACTTASRRGRGAAWRWNTAISDTNCFAALGVVTQPSLSRILAIAIAPAAKG